MANRLCMKVYRQKLDLVEDDTTLSATGLRVGFGLGASHQYTICTHTDFYMLY